MQDYPQVTLTTNPIQDQLQKFIKILNPIYQKLAPTIRFRRNHNHLIASDVVIMATMLLRIELRDPSESHFHHQLKSWGLRLPERSRYHRRCKDLAQILKLIQAILLKRWATTTPSFEIIDSAPITLASARRSQQAKVLRGIAQKGFNATKGTYYYGLKLHAVMDDQGFFRTWDVTAANVDDRQAAEELLAVAPCRLVLADGGYLSQPLNDRLVTTYGIHLWTPKRRNMAMTDSKVKAAWCKNHRRRIETGFDNLNTVGHFEHPRIQSLSGLAARLAALFVWHTIKVHEQLEAGRSGLKIIDY